MEKWLKVDNFSRHEIDKKKFSLKCIESKFKGKKAIAKSVIPISIICHILRLAFPFCLGVLEHEQWFSIPCLERNEAHALNSPPLSDCKLLRLELNWFSTKDLNLKNTNNTQSLVCKGYIHKNKEKSSTNSKKYFAPIVERVRAEPP